MAHYIVPLAASLQSYCCLYHVNRDVLAVSDVVLMEVSTIPSLAQPILMHGSDWSFVVGRHPALPAMNSMSAMTQY